MKRNKKSRTDRGKRLGAPLLMETTGPGGANTSLNWHSRLRSRTFSWLRARRRGTRNLRAISCFRAEVLSLRKTPHCSRFVVVHVENGIQLGDLQKVLDP